MKIDPDSRITAAESAASQTSSKPHAPTTRGERSRDRADLSSAHSRAAALTAQVNQLPEVRQDKVAAIATALRQGTYQVSPEQTAEAILSQLHTRGGNPA
jgi:flagellar biosynthesis anti-sigma factor FlgM